MTADQIGIIRALAREFDEPRACFTRDLFRVSTADRRYALWTGDNRYRTPRDCLVGDGYIILRRQTNGRWTRRYDGSWTGAPCRAIGTRVAGELVQLPCE